MGLSWDALPPEERPAGRQNDGVRADRRSLGSAALGFREMKEHELVGLADEELIAYLVRARRAGNEAAAGLALSVFAYRHFEDLARVAKAKLPTRSDAEDCAQQALEGVLKTAFRGEVVAEALGLLYRILHRRVADFHRDRERKPPPAALPEEQDDEERHSADAAVEPDATGAIDVGDVAERCYQRRSEPHRMVIDDFVYNGYDGTETAERVNNAFPELDPPMSEANVHQIAARFRKDLRRDLEDSS